MSDALDRRLQHLETRRRLHRSLDRLLPVLGWSLLGAAVVVMGLRLMLVGSAWLVWPVVAAGLLLPLVVVPSAWRRRDTPAQLAGHLDSLCRGRGLVMALAAQPGPQRDGDWLARLRQPLEDLRLPGYHWRGARLVLAAASVALVAVLLPQRQAEPEHTVFWREIFQTTEARLQEMEEQGLLPREEREQVRERFQRLQEEASKAGMSQAAWEGLDQIDRRLDQSGRRAAQRLSEAIQQSGRTAMVGEAELGRQLGQLARSVAELGRQAPGLLPPTAADSEAGRNLRRLMRQALDQGQLTDAQLKALEESGIDVARLAKARRLDPREARRLAKHLQAQLEALRAEMAKRNPGGGWDPRPGQGQGEEGGRGGVNRGPGHSPLSFSHDTEVDPGTVQDLPEGARLNPDGSVTLAMQKRDAELDDAAREELVRARQQHFDPGAADARRARVAPRHRQAVGNYFASPADGADGDATTTTTTTTPSSRPAPPSTDETIP